MSKDPSNGKGQRKTFAELPSSVTSPRKDIHSQREINKMAQTPDRRFMIELDDQERPKCDSWKECSETFTPGAVRIYHQVAAPRNKIEAMEQVREDKVIDSTRLKEALIVESTYATLTEYQKSVMALCCYQKTNAQEEHNCFITIRSTSDPQFKFQSILDVPKTELANTPGDDTIELSDSADCSGSKPIPFSELWK